MPLQAIAHKAARLTTTATRRLSLAMHGISIFEQNLRLKVYKLLIKIKNEAFAATHSDGSVCRHYVVAVGRVVLCYPIKYAEPATQTRFIRHSVFFLN
jgi:hypothetical protein